MSQFTGNKFQAISKMKGHPHLNVPKVLLGIVRHCLKNYSCATKVVPCSALQLAWLVASKLPVKVALSDKTSRSLCRRSSNWARSSSYVGCLPNRSMSFFVVSVNNNKICNAHVSTMLGVQGAEKTKTDPTKLVLENLWHKISFKKRFECCATKTRSKI